MKGFIVCVIGNCPTFFSYFRDEEEKKLALMRMHVEVERDRVNYGYVSYGIITDEDLVNMRNYPTQFTEFNEIVEGYEVEFILQETRESIKESREKIKKEAAAQTALAAAEKFKGNFNSWT